MDIVRLGLVVFIRGTALQFWIALRLLHEAIELLLGERELRFQSLGEGTILQLLVSI